MLELGPYANFITACYGLSFLTLLALVIWVHRSETHHKKMLDLFTTDKEKN